PPDQIGCQRGKAIVVTFGPTIFDGDVLTFDEAFLGKSAPVGCQISQPKIRRHAVEEADHRQRLCIGRKRPCCCRASEHCDELAPSHHSITSSARARRVGGTSSPSALAVLRLITNSYFVGACTGSSAGFSPLRMRST